MDSGGTGGERHWTEVGRWSMGGRRRQTESGGTGEGRLWLQKLQVWPRKRDGSKSGRRQRCASTGPGEEDGGAGEVAGEQDREIRTHVGGRDRRRR